MRALVTGGAGFIGSHLAERLLSEGAEVRILDDFSTGRPENLTILRQRAEVIEGSINESRVLRRAAAGCSHVFHLAGLASVQLSQEQPLRCHEVNATGTLQVLEAAREHGVSRLIYAGSSSAYGNPAGPLCPESTCPEPLSTYAAAKLAGEHYAKAYAQSMGLPTVRLRFFNVYGPRQAADSPYSGVISRFIHLTQQGQRPTIFGDGLQTRDFVYVSDVVGALLCAARIQNAVGQVYNVGSGRETSLLDLVAGLAEVAAKPIEPIFAPVRAGDIRASLADISLARSELEFTPQVTLRAGLRQTWDAFAAPRSSPA